MREQIECGGRIQVCYLLRRSYLRTYKRGNGGHLQ